MYAFNLTSIRTKAVLTAAYVAATLYPVREVGEFELLFDYTKGDETSVQIKVEFPYDKDGTGDAYQHTAEVNISGVAEVYPYVINLTPANFDADHKFVMPFSARGSFAKVSAKATGGTPTGTLGIAFSVRR